MQKCEQTFSQGRRWGARPVQNTWLCRQSDGLGTAAAGDAFEWIEQIQVCKDLRVVKCESALINQFLRSGTSIGANIREAFYAHGKADFISKLQIALKECSETEYWIELILESGYYHDKSLLDRCTEIKRILIASLNTAKQKKEDTV
jgi:four helix bundle protein